MLVFVVVGGLMHVRVQAYDMQGLGEVALM